MKKSLRFSLRKMLMLCCLLIGPWGLVSCETQTEKNDEKVILGIIKTDDGKELLVTQVGSLREIGYDDQGRCNAIGNDLDISYNPFSVNWIKNDTLLIGNCDAKLDSCGLLSEFSLKLKEYGEDINATVYFTYDESGHIIRIFSNNTNKETKEIISFDALLTWSEGNLVKMLMDSKMINENDSTFSMKVNSVFEFIYSDQKNKYGQFTKGLSSLMPIFFIEELYYTGMLGKSTVLLPAQIVVTNTRKGMYETNEGVTDSVTTNYSYELNDDGTIAVEKAETQIRNPFGDIQTDSLKFEYIYSIHNK